MAKLVKTEEILFFNDLRKFGWIKIVKTRQVGKEIAPLGPDALSSQFDEKYLTTILSSTRRNIKTVLLDQKKIAGIGNIYANDALFEAGIFPGQPANSLNKQEVKKLTPSNPAGFKTRDCFGRSLSRR